MLPLCPLTLSPMHSQQSALRDTVASRTSGINFSLKKKDEVKLISRQWINFLLNHYYLCLLLFFRVQGILSCSLSVWSHNTPWLGVQEMDRREILVCEPPQSLRPELCCIILLHFCSQKRSPKPPKEYTQKVKPYSLMEGEKKPVLALGNKISCNKFRNSPLQTE